MEDVFKVDKVLRTPEVDMELLAREQAIAKKEREELLPHSSMNTITTGGSSKNGSKLISMINHSRTGASAQALTRFQNNSGIPPGVTLVPKMPLQQLKANGPDL
jgi:hypothetical protein